MKYLTILTFLSLITLKNVYSSEFLINSKELSDFPIKEKSILSSLGKSTGISVMPENVAERAQRGAEALKLATSGLEGIGVKYLVKKSECVAWINLYRSSVVGGIRLGRGMVSCRLGVDSTEWSAPLYIRMGELSLGLQLGIDQSDFFLFFPEKSTLTNILDGNLTLDGNIALTVAKWGRSASAGTDVDLMNAEIQKDFVYSYALSRGAYIGLSFEGGLMLDESRYNDVAYDLTDIEGILNRNIEQAPQVTRNLSLQLSEISKVEFDVRSNKEMIKKAE